jgi:hypothetical protein
MRLRRSPPRRELADLLPLASFCGAPYSVDETSVVKCMCKAGGVVSAGVLLYHGTMHLSDRYEASTLFEGGMPNNRYFIHAAFHLSGRGRSALPTCAIASDRARRSPPD